MAIMPGILYSPVVSGSYPKISRYDIVCVHTIVGYAPASAAHFSTNFKGNIVQSRNTVYQSAANLNGNYRVIAIENEDHGPAYGEWSGSNVPPFTKEQCESIAQICAWANKEHGIPLWLCANSKSISNGIAYHRQGIDGNFENYDFGGRVSGGEVWSKSFGKLCPGDNRIHQLIDVIIPRARIIAGLDKPPIPPVPILPVEDDMFSDADRALLNSISQDMKISNEKLLKLLSFISNNVTELFKLSSVDEIKDGLYRIQRDILNTVYATQNQTVWGNMSDVSWNDLADKAWGRVVNLTP